MKKIALLSVAVVLAACSQQPEPKAEGTTRPTAPVVQTSDYAAQKAAFGAQTPEAPAAKQAVGPQLPTSGNPQQQIPQQQIVVQRADGTVTTLSNSLPNSDALSAQSTDKSVPIILVHGLGGWGNGEFLGINYWGGFEDIVADLRAQGYTVFNASLGPVSSNWDRASELFVQIKGGCVDYGAAHAQEAGHNRYDPAKCYEGFYPEWSADKPVHLIGHSMGAPTARTLVALLEKGSPENASGDNLFVGGRNGWVRGVMTVAGTNTGSPAADQLQSAIPFLKDMILGIAATTGLSEENLIYDLDMGQWGLRRRADESLEDYINRAFAPDSPLWKTNDQAAYDLSMEAAHEANQWIGRSQYTRYFSWATADTYAGAITGWHYPRPTMNPLMQIASYPYPEPLPNGLGNLRGTSPKGTFTYGPEWWQNDGLVPVKVQHAPLGESSVAYTGQATQAGEWYRLGLLDGYDHMDPMGILTIKDIKQFYRDQAALLSSLN